MIKACKVELEKVQHLEFSPVYWKPSTIEEKLAALLGYMTGDGTISLKNGSKTKKLQGAFYSNIHEDIQEILSDCIIVGFSKNINAKEKKTKIGYENGYQVQIGDIDTLKLVELGAPMGKKTSQNFDVPGWIKNGTIGVKRAYISSLFGAKGTTPAIDKSSRGRMCRSPVLNMCKNKGFYGDDFFQSLANIARELGVECVTSVTNGKDGYRTYWLRISKKPGNLLCFFENIGFSYASNKSVLAWKWSKYLRAYNFESQRRIECCLNMGREESYHELGERIGLTRGAAHRLRKDIISGKSVRAGNNFPSFDKWISDRWNEKLNVLKIGVARKDFREEKLETWNVKVSSWDHSYLLSNGVNNFNSFETVTGRIYEDYGSANYTDETIQGHELLHWMHDQNFTPLSSAIGVIRDNGEKLYLLDEIVLESAISRQSAEEFVERYKGHQNKQVYIYGDPHGRAGEKHGHASDYTEIENVLRSAGWKFQRKVKHAAPAIKDRQNAVRARIKNAKGKVRLFVNPKRAEYCHKGLATVQVKAGSTFIEQDSQYQHITTAIGYMVESVWPVNKPVSTSFSVPVR